MTVSITWLWWACASGFFDCRFSRAISFVRRRFIQNLQFSAFSSPSSTAVTVIKNVYYHPIDNKRRGLEKDFKILECSRFDLELICNVLIWREKIGFERNWEMSNRDNSRARCRDAVHFAPLDGLRNNIRRCVFFPLMPLGNRNLKRNFSTQHSETVAFK